MRDITTNFFVLLVFSCLVSLTLSSVLQPPPDVIDSACLLNSHTQNCAFMAFSMPRTGVPYDAQMPSNLKGIKVSAMKLRSGSWMTRGVHTYKEFEIPNGVVENSYLKRLVLVYHNLGNWTEIFYPLPGYSYLARVLGLLAYNATDFDLNGSVQFDFLLPGNVCSTVKQGRFSIAMDSNSYGAPIASPTPSYGGVEVKDSGANSKSMLTIVIPCLVGGVLLLIILGVLIAKVRRTKQGRETEQLESEANSNNESLHIASIGNTKAPLAIGTRTRPNIEIDYYP